MVNEQIILPDDAIVKFILVPRSSSRILHTEHRKTVTMYD